MASSSAGAPGIHADIPHLLIPVVTDPKAASTALKWAVREMEQRYRKLASVGERNIEQFNHAVGLALQEKKGKLTEEEAKTLRPLPYIVIIIDELAELMMVSAQDVDYAITRLAQLARAVGIHLVLATQRPSIDVITGTIKNNFSSRIAFRVPSKIDSRVILDTMGAEKLLGMGDMLFGVKIPVTLLYRKTTVLTADKANEFLADSFACSRAPLERDTGWHAEHDLASGIPRTTAWYREQRWL